MYRAVFGTRSHSNLVDQASLVPSVSWFIARSVHTGEIPTSPQTAHSAVGELFLHDGRHPVDASSLSQSSRNNTRSIHPITDIRCSLGPRSLLLRLDDIERLQRRTREQAPRASAQGICDRSAHLHRHSKPLLGPCQSCWLDLTSRRHFFTHEHTRARYQENETMTNERERMMNEM